MLKSAFGVALSLLFVLGAAPAVNAADAADQQASAPSSGHAKHKRRHHAVVRQGTAASLDAHEKLVRKVVYDHRKRKVVYQRVPVGAAMPGVPPGMTACD